MYTFVKSGVACAPYIPNSYVHEHKNRTKIEQKNKFDSDNSVSIKFILTWLTKTSHPSYHPELLQLLLLPEDTQMCVVQALNTYLDKTTSTHGNCTKLFISVKTPQIPVQTCTAKLPQNLNLFEFSYD